VGIKHVSLDLDLENCCHLMFDDPCLRFFRSGLNHDGYWNGSHAKIQLEDVTDCLSYIFPMFDFVYLFDQSSGHTKMRPDGLNVANMNISYGGAVNQMRDTSVTEVGQYSSLLNVGDLQILSFVDGDNGPFWMNDAERLETKDDIVTSISKTDNTVVKGWMHKPKGMLQILWERGFIDSTMVKTARSSRYSKDGKKGDLNDEGALTEEGKQYSLKSLLMDCTDFRSEVTDLEHLAGELSSPDHHIKILFTPKFHCELAGEGIEYSWGASKRYYRSQPLSKKKSYRSFDELVRWSVGKVSIQMCRRFSGKARGFLYLVVSHCPPLTQFWRSR